MAKRIWYICDYCGKMVRGDEIGEYKSEEERLNQAGLHTLTLPVIDKSRFSTSKYAYKPFEVCDDCREKMIDVFMKEFDFSDKAKD